MAAKCVPRTGKVVTSVAGFLLCLGVLGEIAALFGPWWTDTHIHDEGPVTKVAEIRVTLWNVHVSSKFGRFEDITLDWPEYCSQKYINDESWCHKIRAIRATTIMAVAFGLFAIISFAVAMCVNRGWGARAILFTMLSMICAICAFSISTFYPARSRPSVDQPGYAFIFMCFGAASSLATIILSFYSMLYESGLRNMESGTFVELAGGPNSKPRSQTQFIVPAGELFRAPLARTCVMTAGGLIFVAAVMHAIALFGPWWIDTHTVTHEVGNGEAAKTLVGEIDVTLWKVHVHSKYGRFEDVTLGWEEYCGPKWVNRESWCHRIRAVRATTILASIFALFSLLPLALAASVKKRGYGTCAVVFNLLSMTCAICAFSVSLFYPNSTRPAVDAPGFAFLLVCFGAVASLVANLLACYGLWYNSNSGSMDTTSSGRECKVDGEKKVPTPPPTPYGSEKHMDADELEDGDRFSMYTSDDKV